MSANVWLQMIEKNPGHSAWYIKRFKEMAAEGQDLDGEARFVDAMVPRGSRILDAGCGPGRVGGRLAALGHQVVGVDLDPALIAEAEIQFPGVPWLTRDLSTLDLAGEGLPDGVAEPFDVIEGMTSTSSSPTPRQSDCKVRSTCRHGICARLTRMRASSWRSWLRPDGLTVPGEAPTTSDVLRPTRT